MQHRISYLVVFILLILSIIPSSPLNLSSPVYASPTLTFTHPDTDHYYLANDDWNITATKSAGKWTVPDIYISSSGSWKEIVGLTSWYIYYSAWQDMSLTTDNVIENASSRKCLSLSGSKIFGGAKNWTWTTYVNLTETDFTYTVKLDCNVTVTHTSGNMLRPMVMHSLQESSDKSQYIWFGRGQLYKGQTFYYAEIASNSSANTIIRPYYPYGNWKQWNLREAIGSWTTFSTTMNCIFQEGGTFFDFAQTVSDKMDSLYGLDDPYQYRQFHDSLESATTSLATKIMDGKSPISGWSELVADKEGAYWYSANARYYIGAGEGGNTAQIGKELLAYYDFSQNATVLNHTKKIANFICNRATNTTYWFYYESVDASGNPKLEDYYGQPWIWLKKEGYVSEFLLRLYQITSNTTYRTYALNNLDYWLTKQDDDGSWAYKYNGNDLTAVGSEEYYDTIMVAPLAEALLKAYEITDNSTYKDKAEKWLQWAYNKILNGTNTAGWQGYYAGTPNEDYMKQEMPINIPTFQSCLLQAYEDLDNSTYLTWAQNVEKYRRIFVQKSNGNLELQCSYLCLFGERVSNSLEMAHFAVEPLSKLAYYTGDIQYVKDAVYAQRAMRQYQRSATWYFYDYWDIWIHDWATTPMLWYGSDYLEGAVYLKQYVGDVFLGSEQYGIDEEITVSGEGDGIFAYENNFDADISSATYADDVLTILVSASSGVTSTTKVYCASKGQPINIRNGIDGGYDSTTQLQTVTATHSSTETIILDWSVPDPKRASGYFILNVHLTEAGQPLRDIRVTVKPLISLQMQIINATTGLDGTAQFELPYGTYRIQATHDDKLQTMRVWLTDNKDVGFEFGTPPVDQRGDLVFVAVIIALALVYLLFMRRR